MSVEAYIVFVPLNTLAACAASGERRSEPLTRREGSNAHSVGGRPPGLTARLLECTFLIINYFH